MPGQPGGNKLYRTTALTVTVNFGVSRTIRAPQRLDRHPRYCGSEHRPRTGRSPGCLVPCSTAAGAAPIVSNAPVHCTTRHLPLRRRCRAGRSTPFGPGRNPDRAGPRCICLGAAPLSPAQVRRGHATRPFGPIPQSRSVRTARCTAGVTCLTPPHGQRTEARRAAGTGQAAAGITNAEGNWRRTRAGTDPLR